MPEVNQYTFSNKELLQILIKQAGVRDGRWTLLTNFGISAGSFGPTPEQVAPGITVTIGQMGIQRAASDLPEHMTEDASVVNPLVKRGAKSSPTSNE